MAGAPQQARTVCGRRVETVFKVMNETLQLKLIFVFDFVATIATY